MFDGNYTDRNPLRKYLFSDIRPVNLQFLGFWLKGGDQGAYVDAGGVAVGFSKYVLCVY